MDSRGLHEGFLKAIEARNYEIAYPIVPKVPKVPKVPEVPEVP
jgi:hypothetical protein